MSEEKIAEIVTTLKGYAREGSRLRLDSREVSPGDVFVAVPGARVDGRTFIPVAVARGAAAILLETPTAPLPAAGVPSVTVTGLTEQLGSIAAAFYQHPTRQMRGVAVTGTNGKTTTTHWIAELLTRLGEPCAVLGTVGAKLGARTFESPELTTPDAVSLQGLYQQVQEAGAKAFAIEASSVGLDQGRLTGSDFVVGVFTNLTLDHLDYHKTMQAYSDAKAKLFAWPRLKAAVINADDPASVQMARVAADHGVMVYSTSQTGARLDGAAHTILASDVVLTGEGTQFTLTVDGVSESVHIAQVGIFNVSNTLQAVASVLALGYPREDVLAQLGTLPSPPGRMELLKSERAPLGVVDYSHTPDALEKAIQSLRPVAQARSGALWVVFGCGGDRDRTKRPIMGKIAYDLADHAVVTSDNPRSEDPDAIIAEIVAGLANVTVRADRREAIRYAIIQAQPEDVVLVAGKGHETYQIIKGVHHYFSDQEVIKEAFNERRIRDLSQGEA